VSGIKYELEDIMWNNIKDPIFYSAIILIATIICLVFIKSTQAAGIQCDGRATITIDGQLWPGDSAKLTRELGKVRLRLGDNRLNIIIDSQGGNSDVAQTMAYILSHWSYDNHIKIRTYTYTKALSGAGLLFLIGYDRVVGDLAVVMLHEIWFEGGGGIKNDLQYMIDSELIPPAGAKAVKGFNDLIYQLLKERTTIPVEWVKNSYYISATEAYRHNLATHYKTF
jgi:ATP-dependent protease ClpP protease subunit